MSTLIASDHVTTNQWVSDAIGDFHGGIYPPENKTQSMQLPIGELPVPPVLVFPLNQHMGAPAIPIVAVGDNVLRGQKIADAVGGFSAAIHASSSGTISAIEDRTLPHASGMSGTCIEITTDGKHSAVAFTPCDDYRQYSAQELIPKIRAAGITGLGGAGFPTAIKLQPQAQFAIDTLILNGTECEPYITADHSLMRYHAEDVIEGALLLSYILGEPKNILLGVEDNKPDAIKALAAVLEQRADTDRIRIITFPTKYPSGGEKQLIQLLTGKEVPAGKIPASLGIVMQNVGTAVAAHRAIVKGEPLTSRITTFVGEALTTQQNMYTLLGTPIQFALAHLGLAEDNAAENNRQPLIMGGPMMGFALKNAEVPVVKSTNCVIAPSKQELPPQPDAQECIRCGMCAEVCPASLLPQQLYWYAKAEDHERAQSHHLFDCIECGACSFVCPSNIPLVQYYRASKGAIKKIEQDKVKSDHARQRFEFRKERMAKAEADKAEKREARKQAAAKAKKIQAEKKAAMANNVDAVAGNTHDDAKTAAGDPVEAAMARVKAQQNDPAAQQATLERAVNSAKDRVAKLTEKLHAEPSKKQTAKKEEHKDRTASQLKQAELRLQDAEKALTKHAAKNPIAHKPATHAPPNNDLDVNSDPKDGLNAIIKNDKKTAAIDIAGSAIERAKANAAAMATMSPVEKLQKTITSLEQRVINAQPRLVDAEKDNNENIDAFRAGAEKLAQKLAAAKKELTQL